MQLQSQFSWYKAIKICLKWRNCIGSSIWLWISTFYTRQIYGLRIVGSLKRQLVCINDIAKFLQMCANKLAHRAALEQLLGKEIHHMKSIGLDSNRNFGHWRRAMQGKDTRLAVCVDRCRFAKASTCHCTESIYHCNWLDLPMWYSRKASL